MANPCPASMRPARSRASAAAACTATARSKALSSAAASSPAASRDARPPRRRADARLFLLGDDLVLDAVVNVRRDDLLVPLLFFRQRLLAFWLEHGFKIARRDRADQLVGDPAVASDQEGLRHAIDAPLHRGAAIGVDAGRRERIAVAPEEAARIVGLVL